MDNLNNFLDFSSYSVDDETSRLFDSIVQVQSAAIPQVDDNTTKELTKATILYGNSPPTLNSSQIYQELPALPTNTVQTSVPIFSEQQHDYRWPQDARGGWYRLPEPSLYNSSTQSQFPMLRSQPLETACGEDFPMSAMVRKSSWAVEVLLTSFLVPNRAEANLPAEQLRWPKYGWH